MSINPKVHSLKHRFADFDYPRRTISELAFNHHFIAFSAPTPVVSATADQSICPCIAMITAFLSVEDNSGAFAASRDDIGE